MPMGVKVVSEFFEPIEIRRPIKERNPSIK